MKTYLNEGLFNFYCSGVHMGQIQFQSERISFAKVDLRQRTQMQENALPTNHNFSLPFVKIQESLRSFAAAQWAGGQVTVASGDVYHKHIEYCGTVGNSEVSARVWARRNETAVDVVTVAGEIIAFVTPNRYGMEVLVRPGYEHLTPLVVYDEPLLSKAEYGVNALGTFLVPMRDGVRLATDVYLPECTQPGRTYPTILVRTCYDRNGKKDALMRWANKGYAVVCQDVRGRADSEGELVPFAYERDDGSDTIDWIVRQAWSDNNVGMWGASYLGYVVVAAATSGNPYLKAVVDEVNVGSPFVDTVRRGGTVCSWPLLCWTLAQSVGNRTDFDVFAGVTVSPLKAVDARPIREIPQQMIGKPSGPWELWATHPEYDEFWKNCTFTEQGDQVRVPMFVISGWYDGDSAGVSETWRMLTEHDVPNRKIWLGPWEHNPNRARDYQGQSFSNDAVVYDYDVRVLKWFDRFLKGVHNGIDEEPRATYYIVGENQWKTSDDWTPVESTIESFYLASAGHANSANGDGIILSAPSDSTEDRFVYDPTRPFEDSGERAPEILNKHEIRNDILVYTSLTLDSDLTVAGELSAEIYAASTGVDTDWVVTLCDVDDKGNSIRLSSHIVRAKYRNGLDCPQLLTPGSVEKYSIFMPNLAHTFKQGHHLRFSITSSCKFVAFPNTNTGENPYLDPDPIVVSQTVYHTKEYPSQIKLPVLPSDVR